TANLGDLICCRRQRQALLHWPYDSRKILDCWRPKSETRMIDHIGFPVTDYPRSKAFYEQALATLGYVLVKEIPASVTEAGAPAAGFGIEGKPDFWIGGEGNVGNPVHVAILAKDRATVDAFHRAALLAGGKDNGAPGLRPHYHANYYAAFVIGPDGHNIEMVCHRPEA